MENVFLKRGRIEGIGRRRDDERERRRRNRISLISSFARRMRWLIIFPVVVEFRPLSLSLSPPPSPPLSLTAEDDRNDSLLRTLQISPISEGERTRGREGAEGSQGRFRCCLSYATRGAPCANEAIVATRAIEVGPIIHPLHDGRNGVRMLRSNRARLSSNRAPPPL